MEKVLRCRGDYVIAFVYVSAFSPIPGTPPSLYTYSLFVIMLKGSTYWLAPFAHVCTLRATHTHTHPHTRVCGRRRSLRAVAIVMVFVRCRCAWMCVCVCACVDLCVRNMRARICIYAHSSRLVGLCQHACVHVHVLCVCLYVVCMCF